MTIAGYCHECHVPVGVSELGRRCSRCGKLVTAENIVLTPPKPAVKQKKQYKFSGDAFSGELKKRHRREKAEREAKKKQTEQQR